MRYWNCNRCHKKGVHIAGGHGHPIYHQDPHKDLPWLYEWCYWLRCRYCHWLQIDYVLAPYTHTEDHALESALRQFGTVAGRGTTYPNYQRGYILEPYYRLAGAAPIDNHFAGPIKPKSQ